MKRLIIYDLDGTLVDTRQDIADAANFMLGQMGRETLFQDVICRYVGRGLHELIKGCLGVEDPKEIERGAALYRSFYSTHLLDNSRLYPGALETIQRFQSRAQAVITNKPDPYSSHILRGLGVADYFMAIIAGDSGYPKKPDPAAVVAVMERAGVSAGQALLVGDSPIDVETGRRANVLTVGIAQGFAEDEALMAATPDVLVRNFQEFLERAKRERW